MGLKGVTYMRDGSRVGVLERVVEKKDASASSAQEEKKEAPTPMPILPFSPRPLVLQGQTYQADTPIGKTYITINNDQYGQPFEVFIANGKSGSDVMAMCEALGRAISIMLRLSSPVPMRERMRKIVSELSGIGGAKSVGFGENKVKSLPDAVSKVLARHYEFKVNGRVEDKAVVAAVKAVPAGEMTDMTAGSAEQNANVQINIETVNVQQLTLDATASSSTSHYDICPECGSASFAYEEGCKKCYGCGYSEC